MLALVNLGVKRASVRMQIKRGEEGERRLELIEWQMEHADAACNAPLQRLF